MKQTMKRPNFFIVGAAKCGTTALHTYLGKHPQVFMTHLKEPHYFAEDYRDRRSFYIQTLEDYLALFRGASERHLAVGEASVWYLFSKVACRRIREFDPSARVIVMLRNPIEMVHSLHGESVYSFIEPERDFRKAWSAEILPENRLDPTLTTYADLGRFADHVERLFQVFPREQIHVVLFEEFRADTRRSYEEVLAFLGVDSDGRSEFPKVKGSRRHRSQRFGRLLQSMPRPVWTAVTRASNALGGVPLELARKLAQLNTVKQVKQTLKPALREEMAETFRDDIERLSEILGRDLRYWLSPVVS